MGSKATKIVQTNPEEKAPAKVQKKRRVRGPSVPAALVTPLAVLAGIKALRSSVPPEYNGVHMALDMADAEMVRITSEAILDPDVRERLQQQRQNIWERGSAVASSVAAAVAYDEAQVTTLPEPAGQQVAEEVTLGDGSTWTIRRNDADGMATGYRRNGTREWHTDIEGLQAVEGNAVRGTDADGFEADGT